MILFSPRVFLQQKLDSQIAALQETVVELTNGLGGIKQIYEDLQSLGTIYNGLTTALDKFSVELDQTVPTVSSVLFVAVVVVVAPLGCDLGSEREMLEIRKPLNGLWLIRTHRGCGGEATKKTRRLVFIYRTVV